MDDGVKDGEVMTEESDLVAIIDACAKEARQARAGWVKEAKECYGFVSGSEQWTADELATLRDQRRPPVAYNLIEPVVNVVSGLEVTNRQEVKYLPREVGDSAKNEVLTGAAEWVRDECNAEDEESEAFTDMIVCGEGWTETRLDYEYEQDGMIIIERVDPLEMLPDPKALRKNYKDAEYIVREKMVSLSWVKATWPDKAEELDLRLDSSDTNEFEGETHHQTKGDQYASGTGGTSSKASRRDPQVKLVEYQYKERVPYYRIQDPATGQVAELTVEQHEQVQANAAAAGMPPLKAVRQSRCVYRRAYKVGATLLEDGDCPDKNSFTYKAMTAKRDRNKGCWYGLVRSMLDPQRWTNKFFSQSMFILNTNAKGGVLIEKDAVGDLSKFEQSWAQPDKVTVVEPGAIAAGKVQAKVPPPFPPELAKLMEFSISSIYRVSGVSPEMLGSVQHEQAAVLEYQRKQAGVTILATLFDALRKYRKEQGKTLLYLIQNYLADGRLVRIVGERGAQYVPLLKEEGVAQYDVIIDESPSSPNQKEKTWAILQSLLPMLMKAGIEIPPEVFEYLPLPQSMIDSIKNPDPQKQQDQQQAKEMQLRATQAEVDKTVAEAEKAKAEAMLKAADAQIKANEVARSGSDAQAKMAGEIVTAQKKAEMDRWRAQQEASLKAWSAKQEADLAEIKLKMEQERKQREQAFDMEMKRRTAEEDTVIRQIPDARQGTQEMSRMRGELGQLGQQMRQLQLTLEADVEIVRDPKGRAVGSRRKKPQESVN